MMKLDERWIILIYFILKPLYFFKSGLPQISDMFLILMIFYLLLRDRGKVVLPKKSLTWITVFAGILIYQVLIDIIWTAVTGDTKMLINAMHYVFNFLAAVLCIFIGNRIGIRQLVRTVAEGCFWCAAIILFGMALNANSGIRRTGFFNNPNQLGYIALILLSCVLLFEKEFSVLKKAILIGITIFASIFSLSKASIIGIGGLAVCYTIFGNADKKVRQTVFQVILILLICFLTYWLLFSDSRIVLGNRVLSMFRRRILNLNSENDSSLGSGRGYTRVFEMGVHFFWGMGEGAYRRFTSLSGYEVHSTYINTLVSYGLIGMIAYAYIFLRPLFNGKYTARNFACFSGILLYFVVHNGIRNTLLWILIAVVLQISIAGPQEEERHMIY